MPQLETELWDYWMNSFNNHFMVFAIFSTKPLPNQPYL